MDSIHFHETRHQRGMLAIRVTSDGMGVSEDFRDYAERRVRFAFRRHAARIRLVEVLVADLNGPRNGIDQQCRIRVELMPQGCVAARTRDVNVCAAVAVAAKRAASIIDRRLKTRRSLARFRLEERP